MGKWPGTRWRISRRHLQPPTLKYAWDQGSIRCRALRPKWPWTPCINITTTDTLVDRSLLPPTFAVPTDAACFCVTTCPDSDCWIGGCGVISGGMHCDLESHFPQVCSILSWCVPQVRSQLATPDGVILGEGSPQYANDIWHAYTTSSQNSTCTVEPGTTADTAAIVRS
jgi:hypothetical protein